MKTLVVVPTYNERDNISTLVQTIYQLTLPVDILVVDDSSPDGTADVVRQLSGQFSGVHLLSRPKKEGLGRAYLAGFKWGLERDYDQVVEMDADFSHRPEDLKKLLAAAQNFDFVVGSRYVDSGRTVNWSFFRKLISRGGSWYSRFILGFPLRDWTGGFNLWKKDVLKKIDLEQIHSEGYSFQIELKYRALKRGFQGFEVPIVFEDRRLGQSKMSSRIFFEALLRVWVIRFET